jgi:biogenesis of lysosome-related organelles complex 1 subunit 2
MDGFTRGCEFADSPLSFFIAIVVSRSDQSHSIFMSEPDASSLHDAATALSSDIAAYMQLQTEELADTFELVFTLNQAAIGRYGELIQEAAGLREKAKALQEQEIGIASFLSNLTVIEQDIARLEDAIGKLERYCTLLEQKAAKIP